MSGPVVTVTIAAILAGATIVISMCILADRLAHIPDSKVTITDTARTIAGIIAAVVQAVLTIFAGRPY
ncbi:hypothetical protein [Mycobacterium avium]|uniref:hypothetical protein n=1 Tax=Mycobacterium avium TaxID=1764 RepID=UPI000AEC717A|nr:hypothetical protein [Mycobacterium avium]